MATLPKGFTLPHLSPETRRRTNMVNMRRRREITIVRAVHELFLNCQCQVYLDIHHTDEDKHYVYNSEPGENFPVEYSRLRNYYPKPQINTPNDPQYLLRKALERIPGVEMSAGPADQPMVAAAPTTGDTAAPDGHPSGPGDVVPGPRPLIAGGPSGNSHLGQPSTPPCSPPSTSTPPPAPGSHSPVLARRFGARVQKSPCPKQGRYKVRNRMGMFVKG